MATGWIAEPRLLGQMRQHRLQHPPVKWRGGIVVEIDRSEHAKGLYLDGRDSDGAAHAAGLIAQLALTHQFRGANLAALLLDQFGQRD